MYVYVIMIIILHTQIYVCIWCISYFLKNTFFALLFQISEWGRIQSLLVRGSQQNSKEGLNYKNKESKIYLAKYNIDKNSRLFVRQSKVGRIEVWKEGRRPADKSIETKQRKPERRRAVKHHSQTEPAFKKNFSYSENTRKICIPLRWRYI